MPTWATAAAADLDLHLERLHDRPRQIVIHLAPPVRERLQHRLDIRYARDELKGSCPVGFECRRRPAFLVRRRRTFALSPSPIHDQPVGNAGGEERIGLFGIKLDGQRVRRLAALRESGCDVTLDPSLKDDALLKAIGENACNVLVFDPRGALVHRMHAREVDDEALAMILQSVAHLMAQ